MDIGIVGAGFIGGTLARMFAAAGHQVRENPASVAVPQFAHSSVQCQQNCPAWNCWCA